MSFLTLPEDGSKLSDTDFTLFLRSLWNCEKWPQCIRYVKYLQPPNFKNIKNSSSHENYDEIYARWDD